ncbi:importin-4 isoform X2 [Varanus komodoensis]|uniref:importin-4 isoform X2 n=1 Tax=Varanus komodoensis TaxID=61221 RepID=UPI001CF7B642|nr:importin-4 isoform X2 [Varanus komodoensis]
MATEELEKILLNLLQPDNAVIQQATVQLKEALKQPLALSHLCHVMSSSQSSQIRQFAAVLVRRRLTRHWRKLGRSDQDMLKALVLSTLQQESDHKVSLSLAQLAAVILKYETVEKWPQVFQLIQHGARSRDPIQCQVGLLLLHCALEADPDVFSSHSTELLRLFHQTLNSQDQPAALYYSLRSLTTLVAGLGSDEMKLMSSLVPKIISAIRQLMVVSETQASEAMEVFDELMETEVGIIVQHFPAVFGFCLEVASNPALGNTLRVKALSCISFFIKFKGRAILRHKLLSPTLNALFPIMSAEPPPGQMDAEDEQAEEDMEDRAEVQTPKHYAAQVVDMLALHLPPEKLFPHLTPLMEPALLSPNPYHRKAGLMCLAVLAEGCGDHIRKKHLKPMLQVVCQALSDENQVVRNAALFALGQFSENLQPDIAEYADDIMHLLLRYLEGVHPGHTSHLAKAYYALENFVENLEGKIEPYLPALMERMLTTLSSPSSPRTKELAISAIGAIAQAARQSLLPYFETIMKHLREYLLTIREDLRPVQIQSTETLSVLASTMPKEAFLPLAEECCQLGLDICEKVDDSDLRKCAYSLFGSLSCVMEDSMAPYLPRITTLLLYTIKSTEGIEPQFGSGNSFLLFDDEEEEAEVEGEESLSDDEEDDNSELMGLSMANTFMEEKEDACMALGEIATNASTAFLPYMENCFHEIHKLLECPHISVRKSAFEALGNFCISLSTLCKRDPSEPQASGLQKLLSLVLPVYIKGIRQDKERQLVMGVLEMLEKVLKSCQQQALQEPGRLAELCQVIREVLEKKTACQDTSLDDDEEEEEDEEEAEYDLMLLEYAGEVMPTLAKVAGGEAFAPYFAGFLPQFLNKLKPSCTCAEKSFAVGAMAETIDALGPASAPFVPRLLPVLMGAARDADREVRSNAIYGLGVLAQQSGAAMHEHYPKLLGLFSNVISQERKNRVADNVCGAIARMVMTHPEGVPIGQVFPALIRSLPLKEDFEEYKTVFHCISFIYEHDPQLRGFQQDLGRKCSFLF